MSRPATIILLTLFMMAAALFAADPVAYPDSYAGQQMQQFVTALNSGDMEAWKAYIRQEPRARDSAEVLERRLGLFQFIYDDLGGVRVHEILKNEPYAIEALVEGLNPTGMTDWAILIMHFDTLPPHGWAGFGLDVAADPDEKLPEGKLTRESLTICLDNYLEKMAAADRFSGAVLVAREGEVWYRRAFGEACKRYHVPNQPDTKFNLGSMNKMFTSTAIAQLEQQGKLTYDDLVGKYLPDFPNEAIRTKVTIHHLLTHTSGMGDYWEALFDSKWWTVRSVEALAALTAENPLLFEPGERFSYSNAGPVVLGLVIEKLTGMTYDEYIRQFVTGPAGMINTDCYEIDSPVENLAIGYTKNDVFENRTDDWHSNLFMHAAKGGPAGGGFSTVDDLLRFDQALRSGELVDSAHFALMTQPHAQMGPEMSYGYLFGVEDRDGHKIVGHSGGAPGINADLKMYLDLGWTVAVMANYDMAASMVSEKVDRLIFNELE